MRIFCKHRLWGFRLGPTDVTHQLLTFVHCPFNLLRSLKDGIEVKRISSSYQSIRHTCDVHACLRLTET